MNLGFGNSDFGLCVTRPQRRNEALESKFLNQSFKSAWKAGCACMEKLATQNPQSAIRNPKFD